MQGRLALVLADEDAFAANMADEPLGPLFTRVELLQDLGWTALVLRTQQWEELQVGEGGAAEGGELQVCSAGCVEGGKWLALLGPGLSMWA